ncbi:unnamed protein product [Umbelopsis ramanniana]
MRSSRYFRSNNKNDSGNFELDSRSMTVRIPGAKIRDLRRSIREALLHSVQTPRKVHSLTMRIKSATLAIFPANLHSQALIFFKHKSVKTKADWGKTLPLPPDYLENLRR